MTMRRLEENAVLVIVDVQKGFDSEYWGKRNNPNAEENIARLLAEWRLTKRPIVFFKHMSRNPDSPLRPGQPGNEFKAMVYPSPNETVFEKDVNSCFIGTGFEKWLRDRGYGTLVITGLTTQHCVSTTARMSGNLGFRTIVVSDATAANEIRGETGVVYDPETVHEISLATINKEFAEIEDTDSIIEMVRV